MEKIQQIISTYGFKAVIFASVIILIVGVLKYFKLFDKIPKDWRKFVFYVIDMALSFGIVAVYFAITKTPFTEYVYMSLGVDAAVIILYTIYENCGGRKLIQVLGNFIVSKVANEQIKNKIQEINNTIPAENKTANNGVVQNK